MHVYMYVQICMYPYILHKCTDMHVCMCDTWPEVVWWLVRLAPGVRLFTFTPSYFKIRPSVRPSIHSLFGRFRQLVICKLKQWDRTSRAGSLYNYRARHCCLLFISPYPLVQTTFFSLYSYCWVGITKVD